MNSIRTKGQAMGKYRNKKVIIDGITFDSHKEARRYSELTSLARAGEISELQRQVEYILVPSQTENILYTDKRGKDRLKTKVIERPIKYIADFVYRDKTGCIVVEDVKGKKTKEYIIKRKLMLYLQGIKIKET